MTLQTFEQFQINAGALGCLDRYIDSLSTVLLYFLIEYYFVCFRLYVVQSIEIDWTTVLFETKRPSINSTE